MKRITVFIAVLAALSLFSCKPTIDLHDAPQAALYDAEGSRVVTDRLLSSLSVSNLTLSPSFSSNTFRYTASVVSGRQSVTVTASPLALGHVVSINGGSSSATVNLSVGENTIRVAVGPSGLRPTIYRIVINRAASGVVLPRNLLCETYAVWHDAAATFTASADLLGLTGTTINTWSWTGGNTTGNSSTYTTTLTNPGLQRLTINVTDTAGTSGTYYYDIPVAKKLSLPANTGGFFTTYDFMSDDRLLCIAGRVVKLQNAVGGTAYTDVYTFSGADPAFIRVSPNGDYALVGVGAGGGNPPIANGSIWKITPPSSGTTWTATQVVTLSWHFSMDWIDNDTIIVNAGATSSGSGASLYRVNVSTGQSTEVVTIPNSPSAGVWVDRSQTNYVVYAGTASTTLGAMGGEVRSFTRTQIENAFTTNTPIAFTSGTQVMTNTTHTQYAVLGDYFGNLFVTGGPWGGTGVGLKPGYCPIPNAPVSAVLKATLPADASGETFAATPFTAGVISENHKYIGFTRGISYDEPYGFQAVILKIRD